MYIGWISAGRIGAAFVAGAFILASFLMAVLVAAAYVRFGQLAWIHEAFYGIGAAVIAIIAQAAYRLFRKTIGTDLFLWALFAAVAVTTVWTGSEIVWLFVFCGVLPVVPRMVPQVAGGSVLPSVSGGLAWFVAGLQGPVSFGTLAGLGLFFLKAGAFVFGSGLAIVPFLYGGVVTEFHWLTAAAVGAIAVRP